MSINVQSWDGHNINDGTNYITGFATQITGLPPAEVQRTPRTGRHPLVSAVIRPGMDLLLDTIIEGANAAKREQLRQWFDYEDETPKALVIESDDGTTQQIYAVVEAHYEAGDSAGIGNNFMTLLKVHDDPAWQKTTLTTPSAWNITSSGQMRTITNAGEKKVFPTYKITPTSAKTGTNPFKRFLAIHWRGDAGNSYPTDVTNDGLDTRPAATNFDSVTGDDIRLLVDGVLTDFWLDGINTTTTKIWANLNWSKGQTATLKTALGSGSLETIDVNEDISGWGSSGIMRIDNEIFFYSSKNNSLKRFFVQSRAAKSSTAATHSAGATVRWIQHDITITYGSSALSAWVPDDDYKPIFNLATSTNSSWDFDEFGSDDGLRTGAWQKGLEYSTWSVNYTADAGAVAPGGVANTDPWEEIGIYRDRVDLALNPYFYFFNPCGISSANFQNGEKYADFGYLQWNGRIGSGINGPREFLEYQVPDPTANATWESWSRNETLRSGSKYVNIELIDTAGGGGTNMYMECADVTLTLNSSGTPVVAILAEQGNYSLAATLTNNDTGLALSINFEMELNETLTIDTLNGTVTYEKDSSSQYAAVERAGGPRRDWLVLLAGSNELQFDDTGTNAVTINVEYRERRGA